MKNSLYYLCLSSLFAIVSCAKKDEVLTTKIITDKNKSAKVACYSQIAQVSVTKNTNNAIYKGQTVTIKWTVENCSVLDYTNVQIVLKRSGSSDFIITPSTPLGVTYSGQFASYNWTIPSNLLSNNDYYIEVIPIQGTYALSGSTAKFCIQQNSTDFLFSPRTGNIMYVAPAGGTFNAVWNKDAIPESMVTIELLAYNSNGTIISTTTLSELPNTGSIPIHIFSHSPRGNYKLRIWAENNYAILSETGFFQVLNY